jgi:hypothetical protein
MSISRAKGLRSLLILSFHLRLGFPTHLSQWKECVHFWSLPRVLHALPILLVFGEEYTATQCYNPHKRFKSSLAQLLLNDPQAEPLKNPPFCLLSWYCMIVNINSIVNVDCVMGNLCGSNRRICQRALHATTRQLIVCRLRVDAHCRARERKRLHFADVLKAAVMSCS